MIRPIFEFGDKVSIRHESSFITLKGVIKDFYLKDNEYVYLVAFIRLNLPDTEYLKDDLDLI